MIYKLKIAEQAFDVEVGSVSNGFAQVTVNGTPYDVNIENFEKPAQVPEVQHVQTETPLPAPAPQPPKVAPAPKPSASAASSGAVVAPIPGMLLQIKVSVGDTVTAGQCVAIVEAMKMENDIPAPISGTVEEIRAKQGVQVSTGEVIMVIS